MEIDDGLGTEFKVVDLDHVDPNSSPLRARVSYAPAIRHGHHPPGRLESATVEIDLKAA